MGAPRASEQSIHRVHYEVAASNYLNLSQTRRVAEQIARLRHQGFHALPLPNLMCAVDGLYLFRFTDDGYLDTVVVRAEDCAVAVRVPDSFDPAVPLREPQPVWSNTGDLRAVVGELVRIDGEDPGVPRESPFSGNLGPSK